MKLKSVLCVLSTVYLLLLGNSAAAGTCFFDVAGEKELSCTRTEWYHDHDSYLCYSYSSILKGSAELNPWDLQVMPNGSIEVPLTIKIEPNKKDLNSPTHPTTKSVLFKYTMPTREVYENGRLITDPITKAMYFQIYEDIMSTSRTGASALELSPIKNSYPHYDGYGNLKYYKSSYQSEVCNLAHSRKDNVIYLSRYWEYGSIYFPALDEYYDGDVTSTLTSYRLMKSDSGVWKEQEYELDDTYTSFDSPPRGTAEWNVCKDQAAIERLAQGLGVNGKGR